MNVNDHLEFDVVILGGGPAGSTVGTLLKKYLPDLRVSIWERELFPREHVGESQLPAISGVLAEMGVWEKVESANFPIKVGSTYRWGNSSELWNLNFLTEPFSSDPRPGKYEGQRTQTAFQVDRSIYDSILLSHAQTVGCEVHQGWKAGVIDQKEDSINAIEMASQSGEKRRVTAKHFIDATGSGLVRKKMGVDTHSPTSLRNVAIWDYWQNAEWAETLGNGGTRVQVMSIGHGWLWFIPITPTRTSIGLVTSAEFVKNSDISPQDLYLSAIECEPRIKQLVANAKREDDLKTTKDWSYVSDRLTGDNWYLVGDSCGFADPILAAGMTLAHVGARKLAYTICEIERGELPTDWLKSEFERTHRKNILQHIRFADFWYSANGCFTDLKEYCTSIAADAGLDLDADSAFQWLSTGGFTEGLSGDSGASTVGFSTMSDLVGRFTNTSSQRLLAKKNEFRLNLAGAFKGFTSHYIDGHVLKIQCYTRGNRVLPLAGGNAIAFSILQRERDALTISKTLGNYFRSNPQLFPFPKVAQLRAFEIIEALCADGWVKASSNKSRPFLTFEPPSHN